jgi:hypothetical protein
MDRTGSRSTSVHRRSAGKERIGMARVRVTCTGCGDVTVSAVSMTATIVGESGGCYAFACPQCQRREGRVAGTRILQALAANGASVLSMADPATLERRPSVAPLTVADVEHVSRMLDDDVWFEGLLAVHITDQSVEP